MRGRAQKAGQTSSPTVQPATSSPATVVEPPTERAPAEGEAPAPAGAAGCAMDGAGDGVDERRAAVCTGVRADLSCGAAHLECVLTKPECVLTKPLLGRCGGSGARV